MVGDSLAIPNVAKARQGRLHKTPRVKIAIASCWLVMYGSTSPTETVAFVSFDASFE